LSALVAGCGGCSKDAKHEETEKPFVLGDLVEPFDPPTLEALDAKVEWVAKPVLDSMKIQREILELEGKPELSPEEALQLRNTSDEINQQIVHSLGQLAEENEADYEATIVRHTGGDVKSTNPLMISSTAEFDVTGLTSYGLFSFDQNFRNFASSDTVVSWHSSKDGLYDKVKLRDDLSWSDGKPITAHDVVFSFKAIMSSQVPVPAVRSGTDKLKWIEAYDDYTLVFFHKESLVTNTANMNFPVIPKHVYESTIAEDPTLAKSDAHIAADEKPVVGGSYIITKRERGKEIVLERRDAYYMVDGKQVRDKPYFKTVRFRVMEDPGVSLLALKAGEIEEFQVTPEQWMTQTDGDDFYKNNTKAYGLEWVYFYFGWNAQTPYFSDARVRRAMGLAFDHKELLEKLRYGLDQPCNGIFHSTSQWAPSKELGFVEQGKDEEFDPYKHLPAPYERDVVKAEALLDEAGWIDSDGDGIRDKEINGKVIPFKFTIQVNNAKDRIDICTLLQQNLEQIGVECSVKPTEFTVLQQNSTDHKFQAMLAGWGTGTDPDTSDNLWVTGENRNYVVYSNEEIDELFEKGRREFDLEKRRKIYATIHNILYRDQPYTWLYFRNSYFGFNKRLRGYNFSPRGPYNYGPGFGSIFKPLDAAN
jgi:peptide/nickel transport system substrate-binding protein